MKLLDLPVEMLKKIMETLVIVNTLDQAIMLRLVCKSFDIEIIRALCTTKAFETEVPGSRVRVTGERLLSEYLIARTLADRACTHHLSEVIRDTIDYILKENRQDRARRVEYTQALCVATVQSHGFWEYNADIYDLLNATRPHLLKGRKPRRLECSVVENALAATAYLGLSALFQKLIEGGVEDALTYFGRPLKIAAGRGDLGMTRLLLEKGSAIPELRKQAMGSAASNGHTGVLELLLDPKYNAGVLDEPHRWYWTHELVIYRAADGGHLDTLRFLVQWAASRGLLDDRNETYLGYPKTDQKPRMTDVQDAILWRAAHKGHEEVVRTALDNGANPHPKRWQLDLRWTPLDAAAKNGHEGVVRLLLAKGANPVAPRGRLHTLVYAVRYGWLRIAQILIDNGAEVNPVARDIDRFPLMAAVKRGQVDCVRLLLENGADLDAGVAIGKKAYSYAASRGFTTILHILVEYGVEAS